VGVKNKSLSLRVSESTAVGEARRAAMVFTETLGFDEVKAGQVGIIVTELANNLWRHAGEGEIVFRGLTSFPASTASPVIRGIEILAIDKGPGMWNIEKCMEDGYSSGGSSGIGLGAIARLSSFSEIYSRPKQGTVSLSQVWAKPPPKPFFRTAQIGAVCVSVKEETFCGDAWAGKIKDGTQQLLLVDGLGHGVAAATASDEAVRVFQEQNLAGAEMIEAMHVALKPTVGAVAGLIEIKLKANALSFIGIGNIEGRISNGGETKRLLSHNGTLGPALQKVRQWNYSWGPEALLILHTDGISTRWEMESYLGLSARHPSVIAGVLYRDFRRERDDACIVVLREPAEE
jgi:anti-sigma regulatory factor (Ser/Thr protein kinase)